MILKTIQQTLSVLMCTTLLITPGSVQPAYAFQDQAPQPPPSPSASTAPPTVAPQTADQLDALVAPIALYPDSLVAQVLGAATFPDQVAVADYWLKENKNLTGTALGQAVDQQSWDSSVKALTQFPAVLDNMAGNLVWTSSLGEAFHNQQADVMAAVQVMRAKAQAAGNLQSTPQVKVVQQTPQTIVIEPANPQVVYVPQYNPTIVYGAPVVVPLYTPPVVIATAAISFGAGIALGAAFGGFGVFGGVGGFGWGWNAWHCNWGFGGGGGTVIFNHNTYINNQSWHGGNYNGYHPWGPGPHGSGPYGPHPYGPNSRGFRPSGEPDGGRNGDRGLIGGRGGVQRTSGDDRGRFNSQGYSARNRMSGDGWGNRAESERGRSSMHPEARREGGFGGGGRGFGGGGGRGFGGGGGRSGGGGGGRRR
jgi:uncharacterized membrane protein YgcG